MPTKKSAKLSKLGRGDDDCIRCSFKKLKGQRTMIKLYHGDFLEKAKSIPDDSVDLVLTDPPYGTVKGMQLKGQRENAYGWDEAIEPKVLFAEINRILRKNGKAVLFGQEPFTSQMITEAIPNLPFSYRMIWEKDRFGSGLAAKKAPVNYYEDVMVFSKQHSENCGHPLKEYFEKVLNYTGLTLSGVNKALGHRRAEHSFYLNKTQFALCTERTYDDLIKEFGIDEMPNFRKYNHLKKVDERYKQSVASVFNIWEEEPVEDFEDILVYSKSLSGENLSPISAIMKTYQEENDTYWNDKAVIDSLVTAGISKSESAAKTMASHKLNWEYNDYQFLTKDQYDLWKPIFNWEHTYEELKAIDDEYKKEIASTFNLWQKKKTKSNILKYAKDYPSLHPTQKPILLLEDLVKTFSNEGDLVVDLTMGSGSTGVACKNTGRKFIGIEMDDEYFEIAKERIETHEQQLGVGVDEV